MGLIKDLSNLNSYIERKIFNKGKSSKEWELTDIIVSFKDTVYEQRPDFINQFNIEPKNYTCMRDFNHSCIYVPESNYEDFLNSTDFFDKDKSLINLSILYKYRTRIKCFYNLVDKAVPPYLTIKQTIECNIGYKIYIDRIIIVDGDSELYKDLKNYNKMKEE